MFEIVNNRQVIFGENKISEIPGLLKWYGCRKVFFAAYSSSADSYIRIARALTEAGIEHVCYDKVAGEPDLHMINGGRDIFLDQHCDCTLALGGGSVIDTAKAIGMLAVNGGNVEDYQMNGKQVTAVPPLFIAVPTTSGTGAEATKTSVVLNNYNGLKKSLYHTTMIADIVILDPSLTTGLPAKITAATGMDALSHAIESYVSLNASPLTEMYGLKAIELINQSLKDACQNPGDLEARGNMMLSGRACHYCRNRHCPYHGAAPGRNVQNPSRRCLLHLPSRLHGTEPGLRRVQIRQCGKGPGRFQSRLYGP
jgi:alcohol dehydrogenase class IV